MLIDVDSTISPGLETSPTGFWSDRAWGYDIWVLSGPWLGYIPHNVILGPLYNKLARIEQTVQGITAIIAFTVM